MSLKRERGLNRVGAETGPGQGREPVYWDYNATTRLDAAVWESMIPCMREVYGNASSVHGVGRKARVMLDEARERTAQVWRCKPSEVVFTSGGTESNNLAIFGVARSRGERGGHMVTTSVEHHAVLHAMEYLVRRDPLKYALTILAVDSQGRVHPDQIAQALRPDTFLVSVQAANNEIGTLQPIDAIGQLCRQRNVLFHTDAVQWFGKMPFKDIGQFQADLVSCCAHKFHGPKGAGALYIRSPLQIDPILFGGAHENERRAGTENLAAAVGFSVAVENHLTPTVFPTASLQNWLGRIRSVLESLGQSGQGIHVWTPQEGVLPNTIAFSVERSDSIALLAALDLEGICASSGSACAAGSVEPSHVISGLGASKALAGALVRFSLGRENTEVEVEEVCVKLPDLLRRVQRVQ